MWRQMLIEHNATSLFRTKNHNSVAFKRVLEEPARLNR